MRTEDPGPDIPTAREAGRGDHFIWFHSERVELRFGTSELSLFDIMEREKGHFAETKKCKLVLLAPG